MITLRHIKPNLVCLCVGGLEVVFSYDTPVAIALPNGERYRTAHKFSVTTSRHIGEAGYKNAPELPHEDLLRIIDQYTNSKETHL